MSKPFILVACSDYKERNKLVDLLSTDYSVIEAEDEKQAVALLRRKSGFVSAVIIEIWLLESYMSNVMEDRDLKKIPVLTLVDADKLDSVKKYLDYVFVDFMEKPINEAVLKLRLHHIVFNSTYYAVTGTDRNKGLDEVTGIYDKNTFEYQTNLMIQMHPEQIFSLVRIDIRNSTDLYSIFGKSAGNNVLYNIARYIKDELAPLQYCTYGRISTDVFCLCVRYDKDLLIRSFKNVNQKSLFYNDYKIDLCFGVYVINSPIQNISEALFYSSVAVNKCKQDENTLYAFYDETMHHKIVFERQILDYFEEAITKQQFEIYLQPEISLTKNKVMGAEVLLRWEQPIIGLIMPDNFIPPLERKGKMLVLDKYVIENVCRLIHEKLQDNMQIFPISVNLSTFSLYNPDIVDYVLSVAKKYNIPHNKLNFEITEDSYLSNTRIINGTLKKFRSNGFRIILDSFGKGYTSLYALKEIEIDAIKIDLKYFPKANQDNKNQIILLSIKRIATWLGLDLIIKKIETEEEKAFLISIGCERGQGNYLTEPMSFGDYADYIKKEQDVILNSLDDDSYHQKNLDVILSGEKAIEESMKDIKKPFAIFEYSNSKIIVMKMNKEYLLAFGNNIDQFSILNESGKKAFCTSFEKATITGKESSCDCLYTLASGNHKWYHIEFQQVCSVANIYIVSATFTDLTNERFKQYELHNFIKKIQKPDKNRLKIMIVDDSIRSIDVITNLFKDDYSILNATNGFEALEILNNNIRSIALIFINTNMPIMSGEEFLQKKNAIPESGDIPVIAMSTDTTSATQLKLLELGVMDYITKPFVPETVLRRANNVIEHSSRYQQLIKEYNDAILLDNFRKVKSHDTSYTSLNINDIISVLNNVFDGVRLIDPVDMAVIDIDSNGNISSHQYECFKMWGRQKRCKNCTGMLSKHKQGMFSKYEVCDGNLFYVISKPVRVALSESNSVEFIIEMSTSISNHIMMKEVSSLPNQKAIEDMKTRLFIDEQTNVFNKRYFTEMQFIKQKDMDAQQSLGLTIFNINNLGEISNRYGQNECDNLIKNIANTLKESTRKRDSIIRYNENQFIVILNSCERDRMFIIAERLYKAISSIRCGLTTEIEFLCQYSCSYTSLFEANLDVLQKLYEEANKKLNKED